MKPTETFEQFDPGLDFPAYEGRPATYIVCSTPRCGSHFLGHLLQSTGHFGYPLEYYHPDNLARWRARAGTADVSATTDYLFRHRTSQNGLFGIKMHLAHYEWALSVGLIPSHFGEARHILMERRDYLAQAVSFARALQTASWISSQRPCGSAAFNRRLIRRCLRRIAQDNQAWRVLMAVMNKRYLLVSYEDVRDDPAGQVARIAAYLDVRLDSKGAEPRSRTVRQGDRSSQEWLERMRGDIELEAKGDLIGWIRADAAAATLPLRSPRQAVRGLALQLRRSITRP